MCFRFKGGEEGRMVGSKGKVWRRNVKVESMNTKDVELNLYFFIVLNWRREEKV